MQKNKNIGFSLAELMAVVLIVAILAALSVGYYRRSVEQSRFSEGLMAASAIAEGINRAYLDHQMAGTGSSYTVPAISQLDIGIANGENCSGDAYCIKTKYFTITVDANSVTKATRSDGKYADLYSIQIQPHFASSNRDQIACVGKDSDGNGKTFCESMGYVCTDNVCVKQ